MSRPPGLRSLRWTLSAAALIASPFLAFVSRPSGPSARSPLDADRLPAPFGFGVTTEATGGVPARGRQGVIDLIGRLERWQGLSTFSPHPSGADASAHRRA